MSQPHQLLTCRSLSRCALRRNLTQPENNPRRAGTRDSARPYPAASSSPTRSAGRVELRFTALMTASAMRPEMTSAQNEWIGDAGLSGDPHRLYLQIFLDGVEAAFPPEAAALVATE